MWTIIIKLQDFEYAESPIISCRKCSSLVKSCNLSRLDGQLSTISKVAPRGGGQGQLNHAVGAPRKHHRMILVELYHNPSFWACAAIMKYDTSMSSICRLLSRIRMNECVLERERERERERVSVCVSSVS